jgi:hypothetical protein
VGDWPDLWLDATNLKQVKAGGSSQAANTDGKRAIVRPAYWLTLTSIW